LGSGIKTKIPLLSPPLLPLREERENRWLCPPHYSFIPWQSVAFLVRKGGTEVNGEFVEDEARRTLPREQPQHAPADEKVGSGGPMELWI
jgi:hypothetical protein